MTRSIEVPLMKRPLILMLGLMLLARTFVLASTIPIGVLSFDVLTPAANGSPGANAFNISDFTGAFDLPPDFSAATALTLMNATLTADPSGGPSQVIPLGNIGPGPLLDPNGNPLLVLQFPSSTSFTSASFMATLGPTTFARNSVIEVSELSESQTGNSGFRSDYEVV